MENQNQNEQDDGPILLAGIIAVILFVVYSLLKNIP